MSDDSHELVSAYLDGQATEEEVARIEADLTLLQEAADLRAISEELAQNLPVPDPELKDSHIEAALDLFDIVAAGTAESDHPDQSDDGPEEATVAPIVSLAQARDERADDEARQARARPNGVPTWLGVAAGLLIVVGGVGWIASQGLGGDDDAAETASVEPAADDSASEEAPTVAESSGESADLGEAAQGERQAEQSLAATTSTTVEPSLSTPAAADGAAESDAAASDEAEDAEVLEEETADEEEGSSGGGLFPDEEVEEARKAFDAPPTAEELAELAEGPLFPVEFAACGADVGGPEPATLLGFFPISIGDVAGEAFVFDREVEGLSTVVVDGDCQPLE